MSTIQTAIFLEPQGSLRAVIADRKAWLAQTLRDQPYCEHPPHCTILLGKYGSCETWLAALANRLSGIPACLVETSSWHVFPCDTMAKGGQTVALRAELTPALAALQLTVAETLAPFREIPAEPHLLSGREPFASSLRRFGFPFVGGHWIPHFTIGSLLVAENDSRILSAMDGSATHCFFARSIAVWRVAGESHTRLCSIDLAEPSGKEIT